MYAIPGGTEAGKVKSAPRRNAGGLTSIERRCAREGRHIEMTRSWKRGSSTTSHGGLAEDEFDSGGLGVGWPSVSSLSRLWSHQLDLRKGVTRSRRNEATRGSKIVETWPWFCNRNRCFSGRSYLLCVEHYMRPSVERRNLDNSWRNILFRQAYASIHRAYHRGQTRGAASVLTPYAISPNDTQALVLRSVYSRRLPSHTGTLVPRDRAAVSCDTLLTKEPTPGDASAR